jgi:hypothetical protein
MINMHYKAPNKYQQRGVAVVEFAFVALLLFILIFGILEFGRLIYVFNTVQEVTRRAARESVVRWVDQQSAVKSLALFGGVRLPAAAEISASNIDIQYLDRDGIEIPSGKVPPTTEDNISACLTVGGTYECIAFVRVEIAGVTYSPMVGFFTGVNVTAFPFSEKHPFRLDLSVPIPASTVTMPAESMGYSG